MAGWVYRFFARIRALFDDRRLEADLDEELRHHLELLTEENEKQGMSAKDARKRAHITLGGMEQLREAHRESRSVLWIENLWRDVVYACRRAGKSKRYSAVIVSTFALAIGLNVILFNLFNSLWLNPELFAEEDRVVRVYENFNDDWKLSPPEMRGTSGHLYLERLEQSELVSEMGATLQVNSTVTGDGMLPEFVDYLYVTPSLFRVFNVAPLMGRVFDEDFAKSRRGGIAVLFYDYWKSRFDGDPSAIGTTIYLDGRACEIIGVMPESFRVPEILQGDVIGDERMLMTPILLRKGGSLTSVERRYSTSLGNFARLKPGVTAERFRQELALLNERNGPLYPVQYEKGKRFEHRTEVATTNQDLLRNTRPMLILLQGALAIILVLGCINVVGLVLSRNSARKQEFAIRLSLGSTRRRLGLQIVSEVWLFGLVGGGLGVVFAAVGLRLLDAAGSFSMFVVPPRLDIEWRVFVYALLLSSATGAVTGLVSFIPILRDKYLGDSLEEDSRTGSASRGSKRFRAMLLATQIAFTLVLMVGGALLLRSFAEIVRIDPGFDSDNVLTGVIRLPTNRYDQAGTKQFISDFEGQLQELPGVEAAGITNWPPLKINAVWTMHFVRPEDDYLNALLPSCAGDSIGIHYFDALNIKLLKGRNFVPEDYSEDAAVAIIDSRIAARHFSNEDPIDKLIAVPFQRVPLNENSNLRWLKIVGVVEPIRGDNLLGYTSLDGMVYQTYQHQVPFWIGLAIKAKGDPKQLIDPIKELLVENESKAALALIETMEETIERRYKNQQTFLIVGLVVAFVALAISVVGVYGMLAHSISMQKKEIAIRRALGSSYSKLLTGILGYWLRASLVGVVIGLVVAVFATRYLEEVLYGVTPSDLVSFVVSVALLGLSIVASTYAPARSAVSTDVVADLHR